MEQYNGLVKSAEEAGEAFRLPAGFNESSLPSYVNWKKKGVVSKVKNQVRGNALYYCSTMHHEVYSLEA